MPDTFAQRLRRLGSRRHRPRLTLEHDSTKATRPACTQRSRCRVECRFLADFDALARHRIQVLRLEAGGEQNAGLRRCARQFGDDEERLPRERRGVVEHGAAPARQDEFAASAPCLGDPVGIGEREQSRAAQGIGVAGSALGVRTSFRRPRPVARKALQARRALSGVAAKPLQALIEIGAAAAEATLHQNGCDVGGGVGSAELGCLQQHAREARRQR